MNIVQSIRNRMRSNSRRVTDDRDLVLYRQLRSAENKLYDARALLATMQEQQRNAMAANVSVTQDGDDFDQQDSASHLEGLKKKIVSVEKDVNRLEAEYQHAQMNVRTYFYLETSGVPRSEAELMAAQSAQ